MKKILLFLLVVGALAAAWFWFRPQTTEPAEAISLPVSRVETAVLKKQMIAQSLDAFGVVAASPSGDQVIGAAADCLITKILVAPGTRVAAGDVLLEFNPTPDAKLQRDAARNARTLAQEFLTATQERYDLKLANRTELLTAMQAEQEARLKLASFELRGLGAEGNIVAPAAGVVSKLELAGGALAPTGTALITFTAEAQLEVRLGLEAADTVQLAVGQSVTLFSAHRPDAPPIFSVVRSVGRSLDAATGAVEVRVPVPKDAALLLGEHVKATIELNKKEALVAPRRAVLPVNGKLVLYTVQAHHAVRHEVTTGLSTGDLLEVRDANLHEGDLIVTLGNYELSDGMPVQLPDTKEPKP